MARVKFLKSHPEFAYFKDDNAEISDEKAAELLEKGYVIIVPTSEGDDEENTLPADLPARAAIWNAGYKSIEELADVTADDLTNIKGIGKKMAQSIVEYLSK